MRKCLSYLFFQLLFLSAFASDGRTSLVVELKSGAIEKYMFSEELKLDFDGKKSYITLAGDTILQYNNSVIAKVSFDVSDKVVIKPNVTITQTDTIVIIHQNDEYPVVDIQSPSTEDEFVFAQVGSDKYSLAGVKPASVVKVFSVDGRTVPFKSSVADNGCIVDLSELPNGLYIIKVENKAVKIRKK